MTCDKPCKDFIRGGCGLDICSSACHQPFANKGHIYTHEDSACEKCGAPWSDTKSYCPQQKNEKH
jgi:hypothetical protein